MVNADRTALAARAHVLAGAEDSTLQLPRRVDSLLGRHRQLLEDVRFIGFRERPGFADDAFHFRHRLRMSRRDAESVTHMILSPAAGSDNPATASRRALSPRLRLFFFG